MATSLSENNKQRRKRSHIYGDAFFVVCSQVSHSLFTNEVWKEV